MSRDEMSREEKRREEKTREEQGRQQKRGGEMRCEKMGEVRIFGVGVPFGQWGPVQCYADASGGGRFFRFGFFRVGLPPLIIL